MYESHGCYAASTAQFLVRTSTKNLDRVDALALTQYLSVRETLEENKIGNPHQRYGRYWYSSTKSHKSKVTHQSLRQHDFLLP